MILRAFHKMLMDAREQPSPAHATFAKTFLSHLDGAMRFVFRPGATAACEQIAERPDTLEAAREQLFAPWPKTWIEWEGSPNAIFWFADDESGRAGGCIAVTLEGGQVTPRSILPFRVDLTVPRYIVIRHEAHVLSDRARRRGLPAVDYAAAEAEGVPVTVGRAMLAAWALLASKSMTDSVTPDLSKLNASRARGGKYPLLGYQHIQLNLDAERAVQGRMKTGVATGAMPLHPVRAHLRLLPTGKVITVTAHMRGNPENGVRGHHYTIGRDEDFHP